jgi:hypothetical protein
LQIKEDPNKGTYVKDLTSVIVKNVSDTEKAMFYGLKNRKTGETAMNTAPNLPGDKMMSMLAEFAELVSNDILNGFVV